MTTNHDVSKLDDLIVTTIDSIRGYEQAAEHADAGRYFAASNRIGPDRRTVAWASAYAFTPLKAATSCTC